MFFLALFLVPSLSMGQTFDNVGFRKNVPPELRQKFPVCDEFLDVKWVDPERYIGLARVDYYLDDKHGGTREVIVLSKRWLSEGTIMSSPFGAFDIDNWGHNKDFEPFLRSAHFSAGGPGEFSLIIRKGRRSMEFLPVLISTAHRNYHDPTFPFETLSSHTKNVCLILPKEDAAIIVEDKEPFFHGMPDESSKERYRAILDIAREQCQELLGKNTGHACHMKLVEFGTSIDVDGDGKEDYVSKFNLPVVYDDGDIEYEGREFVLISGTSHFFYIPVYCGGGSGYYPLSYNAKEQSLYYGTCNLTKMSKGVR